MYSRVLVSGLLHVIVRAMLSLTSVLMIWLRGWLGAARRGVADWQLVFFFRFFSAAFVNGVEAEADAAGALAWRRCRGCAACARLPWHFVGASYANFVLQFKGVKLHGSTASSSTTILIALL